MSDLLKEFENDMRRERSEAMWKNMGKYLVWMSIAIVLGTAGGVSWRYWQQAENMEYTSEMLKGQELLDAGDYKKASAVLGALSKNNTDIRGLAALREAHALEQAGDEDAARAAYAELAKQSGDKVAPYAALASMSTGAPGILPEPGKDQPFYHSRLEWRAWQLVEKGETDQAAGIFTALVDDGNTPATIRGRATEALQLMAPHALLEKIAKEESADEK
ncbi:MAG: tetratricopeptide repeat protein [Alphaproteobacteria bacterium]